MSVDPAYHFSPDYRGARDRFLRAAQQRGATVWTYPLEPRGSGGEEIGVDVAYVGPRDAEALVVISSGLHGIEGFAGSAVQHQLLTEQLDGLALPNAAGLMLVHALNPFGFAALRRVNESNVDLNRNFLRHPDDHVPSPDYDRLYAAINPDALDEASEQRALEDLRAFASEHGVRRLQEVVSSGQYRHPRGMQFGGSREEASNLIARQIVREHVRATRVAWVDVHTGLGAYGDFVMLTALGPGDPAVRRGGAWYGAAVQSVSAGQAVTPVCHGSSDLGLATEFRPDATVTFFAQEFGTYNPTRVFRAMRADNWLQHHGDTESEDGRAIKAELLEVFRPADPAWQRAVLDGGARVIRQARDGLAGVS